MGRRDFGSIRRLPSGRYQVRYPAPDGGRIAAPSTFATKTAAADFLAGVRTDQRRGAWVDPREACPTFAAYSATWLAQRVELRPRTVELYGSLLRLHLLPDLGPVPLDELRPSRVRAWYAARVQAGTGRSTTAKAYRLLKTILGTAVADELIPRNPCLLRGAGSERTPARTPPTLAEVDALAAAVDPRWRMFVLVAAWSGLRWGELAGLTRKRVNLLHGTLTVQEQLIEVGGRVSLSPPKTDAGRRVVHLPPHLLPDLEDHLDRYCGADPDAWVFTGAKGAPLTRRNFAAHWSAARAAVGLPGLHFHDLRHLAATLAATTGATTRELMTRMGHASSRAALIYQHNVANRDAAIAAALSELALPVEPVPIRRAVQRGRVRPELPGQLSLGTP